MILAFLPTEAVGNIVKFLGMHPCERSDKVPDNKNTHTLLLAGKQHFQLGRAWVSCSLDATASWAVGSHWNPRDENSQSKKKTCSEKSPSQPLLPVFQFPSNRQPLLLLQTMPV